MWALADVHRYWKTIKRNLYVFTLTKWFGKCISLSNLWFFVTYTMFFMWFCFDIILFFMYYLKFSWNITRIQEKYLRLVLMIRTNQIEIDCFRYLLLFFTDCLFFLLLGEKVWVYCWRTLYLFIVSMLLSERRD